MELGLSLGDASRQFGLLPKNREVNAAVTGNTVTGGLGGFCMALGINSNGGRREVMERESDRTVNVSPPLQLDLLPLVPVPRPQQQGLSWLSDNGSSEGGSSGQMGLTPAKGFDVNRLPPATEEAESSPNSVASTFHMDFSVYRGTGNLSGQKRDSEAAGNDAGEQERASSRASDDDENGLGRKKLRLSKEQSAYLEESFKEHNTLNPKQKLALAKQLNLRPRQVEVWFQNRRARTKLKQTEVDCEYLKRCCETLTEENRRLQKEIQELRALKSTSNPFYMQLPATTLTMCPSCERVATTTSTTAAAATPSSAAATTTTATTAEQQPQKSGLPFALTKTKFFPFNNSSGSNTNTQSQTHQSAAS